MAKINAKKIGRVVWDGTKLVIEAGCACGAETIVMSVVEAITPKTLGPLGMVAWKVGEIGLGLTTCYVVWDKTEEWLNDGEELVLSMVKAKIGKKSVEMEIVD